MARIGRGHLSLDQRGALLQRPVAAIHQARRWPATLDPDQPECQAATVPRMNAPAAGQGLHIPEDSRSQGRSAITRPHPIGRAVHVSCQTGFPPGTRLRIGLDFDLMAAAILDLLPVDHRPKTGQRPLQNQTPLVLLITRRAIERHSCTSLSTIPGTVQPPYSPL